MDRESTNKARLGSIGGGGSYRLGWEAELAQPLRQLSKADVAVAVLVPQLKQHVQLAVCQRLVHLQVSPALSLPAFTTLH